ALARRAVEKIKRVLRDLRAARGNERGEMAVEQRLADSATRRRALQRIEDLRSLGDVLDLDQRREAMEHRVELVEHALEAEAQPPILGEAPHQVEGLGGVHRVQLGPKAALSREPELRQARGEDFADRLQRQAAIEGREQRDAEAVDRGSEIAIADRRQ